MLCTLKDIGNRFRFPNQPVGRAPLHKGPIMDIIFIAILIGAIYSVYHRLDIGSWPWE